MDEVQVYAAMQTGEPIKTYIKTQLGKVVVNVLNPFNDEPKELILQGNPKKYDEGAIIDLWTDKQVVYFERMNAQLIETGWLAEISREEIEELKKRGALSNYSKRDKIDLFSQSYMAFRSFVNKVTDIDFLDSLVKIGKEIEASPAFIKAINSRIDTLAMVRTPQEPEKKEDFEEERKEKSKKTRKRKVKNN